MDNKIKIDLSATDISETTDGKRNSQARDWCFTINNPVQTEQEFITYLKTLPDLRYVVFQREKAPETGTEHYQGYFEFTQPKWFTTIKKHLSKEHIGVDAHIEARRGKRSQAREYCMDEETRISPQFYEYGEFIEDGERTDLTDIMHDIENGMSFYDLSKKHGNRFIRVMKWAKEYRQSHLENKFKRVFRNMKVYYIYGSAGCGKTSYVFNKHGYDDVYRTTNYEFGWIDDYNGEKILFLDEFRSSFKISEILDYLDGQPIRIRGRHYNRVACYDTVYIVSNLSLKEQYTNIQQTEPKTWAAFCRRITAVYDYKLLDIHNTNLYALYWIKREYRTENDDLKMHNYVSSNCRELTTLRTKIEHRTTMLSEQEKQEIVPKSIGLLKIMRNVLLYMNAMVYQESCPSLYKNGIRDTNLVYLSLGNGEHLFN